MLRAVSLCLLMSLALPAQNSRREAVYGGAITLGGQVIPHFANGYLIYLHRPNRIQVFRPDTQLAYEYDVPCVPQTGSCSVASAAVTRNGVVALGIGYATGSGYSSGIRILDPVGKEVRFFSTGRYVPIQLTFDHSGDLWSIGWERDEQINDTVSRSDYNIVRKYSLEGTLKGGFLPKSLWTTTKHGPELGGRGYWTMYAAADRIGALFNENFGGASPEWVEWDLKGALIRRIPFVETKRLESRAFDSKGRLFAQFAVEGDSRQTELKMLENSSGRWIPARTNLPDELRGFLLGADGDELVYRVNGGGNVHLVWSRPD
jgi:hypothetical protein